VGYRYYKGEKRVIKWEKRFDYKKDWNQNKKQ
jgi:hypothetical protein